MKRKRKLEIYKSRNGWRWRLISSNGKIIAASSEAFATKAGSLRNIHATFDGFLSAERVVLG